MSPKRFIVNLVTGIVIGASYYLVYLLLLPYFFASSTSLYGGFHPELPTTIDYRVAVLLLLTIGVMERVIEHPVVAVLRILSKNVGALLLYVVTNGGVLEFTAKSGGSTVRVVADLSVLIYAIIMVSAIAGVVDAGGAIVKYSSGNN